MQTSYEVVKNAVEFTGPDRLPVQFEAFGIDDVHIVNWNQIGTGDSELRETVDEWGCTWGRTEQKNMGQVVGHPLQDWSALDSFRFPDPDNPEFYEGMEERFEGSDGKYVKTSIFMLIFERLHALRGFENALTDLYLERERVEKLVDTIVEYDLRIIENISSRFPGQIHGLVFSDDWGTELNTIISKEQWDEFFKPRYKRVFDTCRSVGWHVWMHSCGKINELIPSLIDIGCNVLNMQQPTTNGIREIGKRFAGRIAFSSLCDIQHTLPFKSGQEIRAEAQELLMNWGVPSGGFVLSDYGDGRAIGVGDDKKRIMLDAFLEFDPWRDGQAGWGK